MSVHKIKTPAGKTSYQVRWREGTKNKSKNFADPKVAKAFDKELRNIRQAGELAAEMDKRRVTINELAGEWWNRRHAGLSQKTRENYSTQLELRILPEFGPRHVRRISVADVERWIATMRKDEVGEPTILKACTVLQAMLTMAVRDGIVAFNVAQQARKPGQGRTRIPYLVKPETVEVMRLWMQRRGRERDVVLLDLLAYAGLRPESEAIVLPWGSVRDRSILARDTKRHRERSIPMIEPLAESLNTWRLRRGRPGPDALVVPTMVEGDWTDDDWRNWRRRNFKPAAVAAGLPADVRPRDLRGSFVSLLVHEGRSIVEVARQVGHSPAICLRDYSQVFDEADPLDRKPATQIIAEARAAAPTALNGASDDRKDAA